MTYGVISDILYMGNIYILSSMEGKTMGYYKDQVIAYYDNRQYDEEYERMDNTPSTREGKTMASTVATTAVGDYSTVERLGDEYGLIDLSQDIAATLESIGFEYEESDPYPFGFLLYKPGLDSTGCMVDYAEVWGSRSHCVAWLWAQVERIA